MRNASALHDDDTQLSHNFWLSEFLVSQTATRQGIRNVPLAAEQANLQRLALLLEDVRAALGHVPIVISSGYRSRALNAAVGGVNPEPGKRGSAHLYGCAADFTAPAFGSPRKICQRIIDAGIQFDQLIHERSWVHFGIARPGEEPRHEVLTAYFRGGKATYAKGLLA